ncbi:hypothetical protein N9N78_00225 [Candidatus Thioglobus sp.]|nr:hypothetical protein [Candidatus Thioglobus sp.]
MNTNYFIKLFEASKTDYLTIENHFQFNQFERINIHLIIKTLLEDKNFWLDVNKMNVDKLYRPVLSSLLASFFNKNYLQSAIIPPQVGDKYHKGNKRYEVIETNLLVRGNEAIKLECTSRGHEKIIIQVLEYFYGDDGGYIKIDSDSGNSNRGTFKPMLDFMSKSLGTQHNISVFPNKFAVVCSKHHLESSFTLKERKAFPYEYITKNAERQSNLPLEDFMFYVAPDFITIRNHVISNNIDLDVIVFLEYKQDLKLEKYVKKTGQKIIIIGGNKPEVQNLVKWQWTLPEYLYFDGHFDKAKITPIVVQNDELESASSRFLNHVNDIEDIYRINLRQLYFYVSYIFSIIIISKESRLNNRIDDLNYFFEKKLNEILEKKFSDIGDSHLEIYIELLDMYREILKQVQFENNAKALKLEIVKETDYVLVPSRQTLAIWKREIKKMGWLRTKVISINKLRKLSEQSTVTVLALEDKAFFTEIYTGIHHIQWLLYADEHKKYKAFRNRYNNDLIEEYSSQDRLSLMGIEYPGEPEIESIENLIDRIFEQDSLEVTRGYEATYHDHINKEIEFIDNTKVILSANSSVIVINQYDKAVINKVGDLRVNDKVRIYENQHKDILFESIIESDEDGRFKKILDDSMKWKTHLKGYCTNDLRINEIAQKCEVAPATVEGWLRLDSATKFPNRLDKLRELLGSDFLEIFKSSKFYTSIMIAAGRDLSDEISEYIINGSKGAFLSGFRDDVIREISNHNMPIKEIKSLKIIDIEPD